MIRIAARLAALSALLCLANACSISLLGLSAPSQLDVEVKHAPRVFIDPEIEKRSSALHNFLMGQLSYINEDYSGAIAGFSEASRLIDEPQGVLDARLAELHVRAGNLEEALAACDRALAEEPEAKQLLLLKAGVLEALDREAEALPIYRRIIGKFPDYMEARVLLAGLYEKQGRADESVRVLEDFVKSKPDDFWARYYLGRALEVKENFPRAEKEYRAAFELEPGQPDVFAALIRVMARSENFEGMRKLCEKVLDRDQSNLLARRVLGQLLIGENRLDEALEHLQVLAASEHDVTATRFKMALIQIEKQNSAEAMRELNLVLAKEPDHQEARYNLAVLLSGSGRSREAVEELAKISKTQSLYTKARTFAAFLLRQMDDLAGAEQAAREAVEGAGADKQALAYLVLILRDARKYEEAKGVLEKALEGDPRHEKLLSAYGGLLHDMGKTQRALAVMERLLAINPQNSEALNFIAYTLAEEGRDLERALELINQALLSRPDDGFYLDTLGWVYFKQGRYQEAEEVLVRAVNITGDDAEILEHYGDTLVKLEKLEKARAVYVSALERLRDSKASESRKAAARVEKKLRQLPKDAK